MGARPARPAAADTVRQEAPRSHRRPYATPEVYRIAGLRIKALARAAAPFLACLALVLAVWGYSVALWDAAYNVGLGASGAGHAQR
ncbi:hypothetical protein [Adlercreutzia caecimuris]|uniref:hypothetical protein n=1 Tax=Adlercreutzia caecimuris TaxID=671266 RepID=UPI0013732B7A|nr:hypothetical protein [Adlercreutzia caecimuris]